LRNCFNDSRLNPLSNLILKNQKSILLGAAFLMATSAIGPGFLTQTAIFTEKLKASFGFVIILSILLDLGVQLNVWRVVVASQKYAQQIGNELFMGAGHLLSMLIVIGGLAFNIGNVAGAGLGLEVLTGWNVETGAVLSAVIAIGIFLSKEAGYLMDRFAQILGFLMLALIVFVAFNAQPPVGQALAESVFPSQFDAMATITLVGGTVGGYITFSGAHRLIDGGLSHNNNNAVQMASRSAITGILITSVVRYGLFLAALGVVMGGVVLDASNPASTVFKTGAGEYGRLCFGLVMWSAAITSVVGSAFTSVSFIRTIHPVIERHYRWVTVAFILFSTLIFVFIGKPIKLLVWVGTLNGFVLPIALSIVLLASSKVAIVRNYLHPKWLQIAGWLVVGLMTAMILKTMV
jgi:Mn2+/Fe2+ NRAMP family transporter